jgi:hypothetical protein
VAEIRTEFEIHSQSVRTQTNPKPSAAQHLPPAIPDSLASSLFPLLPHNFPIPLCGLLFPSRRLFGPPNMANVQQQRHQCPQQEGRIPAASERQGGF